MTALGSVVVQTVVLLTGLVVVQGDTPVGCVFGGSCVLPCRFQPNSDTILHWIKRNGKNVQVHSYYEDQDQLGHQDPLYKGRTSLFHDQISGGNASLGVARVNLQDQGRYLCYANTSQNNQETFDTLTVRGELKSLVNLNPNPNPNSEFLVLMRYNIILVIVNVKLFGSVLLSLLLSSFLLKKE
ncbi:V-set domain-containing T-cell activation inhibitor 1-like [Gadus macrocephalus]|uniref:V-set domain-containing T-cell activation inhibitor 1-like n=1 Tax=Gadus macrocephalus TaxID=80720 RepID=UPI0028CB7FBC|nr:V-set domain-containing T-cell activation inhibitor 1-like [Gadus macrocephalus]